MPNYKIRINKTQDYQLYDWNTSTFINNNTMTLITDDLAAVKRDFSTIEHIEVFCDFVSIYESTSFDRLSEVGLAQGICVDNDGYLRDGLKVTLTKSNLIERVEELDKKINKIVNIDAMTVDEYREYILEQISESCQADIFNGMDINISTGLQHFTFKTEDQNNLIALVSAIAQCSDVLGVGIEDVTLPYHSSGEKCKLYAATDILTMYYTLWTMLTSKTTYCNFLNIHIKTLTTKEELSQCYYGMDLPEDMQAEVNEIIAVALTMVNALKHKYMPDNAGTDVQDATQEQTPDVGTETPNETQI